MDTKPCTTIVSLSPDAKLGMSAQRDAQRSALRRIAVLLAIWIIALVPLLFVRTEWFGRPLSDQQIGEYLHAEQPYLVEHALTQIGDRMARHDVSVSIWYADLVRLAGHHNEAVRALDATVMGNDPLQQSFHDTLLPLLEDASRLVRFRAALALARFGDASGHQEIIGGLQPWIVMAPTEGRVRELVRLGTAVRQSTSIGRIDSDEGSQELLSPVNGRVIAVAADTGQRVNRVSELLQIEPGSDVLIDVLSSLARVGTAADLPIVSAVEQRANVPERVRQQAAMAREAIRTRSSREDN